MGQAEPILHYLPLRARAESLRLLFRHAGIPFVDNVVSLQEWPEIKKTMPPGRGAEFPGRPVGNRALPVLVLPGSVAMPESRDIAAWIAKEATAQGCPLLPADPDKAAAAAAMFDASQALPLFWCIAMLARFPEPIAEKFMRGDIASIPADAKFETGDSVAAWLAQQPPFSAARDYLHELDSNLQESGTAFFGGVEPHYGEFGVFVAVDALISLQGRSVACAGFSEAWGAWVDSMYELPAVKLYFAERPVPGPTGGTGYANSIIMNHSEPEKRSGAADTNSHVLQLERGGGGAGRQWAKKSRL